MSAEANEVLAAGQRDPDILDVGGVMRVLGIGKQALQRLVRAGMPSWNAGGNLGRLFHRPTVIEWFGEFTRQEAERIGLQAGRRRERRAPRAAGGKTARGLGGAKGGPPKAVWTDRGFEGFMPPPLPRDHMPADPKTSAASSSTSHR